LLAHEFGFEPFEADVLGDFDQFVDEEFG